MELVGEVVVEDYQGGKGETHPGEGGGREVQHSSGHRDLRQSDK